MYQIKRLLRKHEHKKSSSLGGRRYGGFWLQLSNNNLFWRNFLDLRSINTQTTAGKTFEHGL